MFERLVCAEAGDEPIDAQIAVANVVINRIKSSQFPNTLKGVLYQDRQFSPVSSGYINRVTPSNETKKAVQRALNGEMKVYKDTLYFFATWLDKNNSMWDFMEIQKTIGKTHFGRQK